MKVRVVFSRIHSTPPSRPSAGRESLIAGLPDVYKYDVDKGFGFDKGVTSQAMRTEGVIRVGPMMEERIFDFDRLCGSHAWHSSFYLCLCAFFTLFLFTKRDRVAVRHFRFSLSFIICTRQTSHGQKQTRTCCRTWISRRRDPAKSPTPELLSRVLAVSPRAAKTIRSCQICHPSLASFCSCLSCIMANLRFVVLLRFAICGGAASRNNHVHARLSLVSTNLWTAGSYRFSIRFPTSHCAMTRVVPVERSVVPFHIRCCQNFVSALPALEPPARPSFDPGAGSR